MISLAKPEPVSNRVRDKLQRLHGARRSHRTARTLAWTAALLLIGIAIALALDAIMGWWSKGVRSLITLSVLATVIGMLITGLRKALSSRRDWELAKIADEKTPLLQERLQTVLSTGKSSDGMDRNALQPHQQDRFTGGSATAYDPVMRELVAGEVDELIQHLSPRDAAKESSLRIPLLVACAGLASVVGVAAWVGPDFPTLAARFVAPTSNITRYQLKGIVGDQVVAEGEAWELQLTASGPKSATLQLHRELEQTDISESDNGNEITAVVQETIDIAARRGTTNQFLYRNRRVEDSFRYQVTVGDLQTSWHQITVAPRPRITSASLVVTPPDYTGQKPKSYRRLPNRLTVIEGSTIELSVAAAGTVDQGMLLIDNAPPRTMWSDDGRVFRVAMVMETETVMSPQLTEPNGLTNLRSPRCRVLTRPDLPPTIRIKTPAPNQKVRPDDTVKLTFEANDDVGIAKARLVVESLKDDVSTETLDVIELPVPMDKGAPVKKWNGKAALDLSKYNLREGESLTYRIEAYDTKQAKAITSIQDSPKTTDTLASKGSIQSKGEPKPKKVAGAMESTESEPKASRTPEETTASKESKSETASAQKNANSGDRSDTKLADASVLKSNQSRDPKSSNTSQAQSKQNEQLPTKANDQVSQQVSSEASKSNDPSHQSNKGSTTASQKNDAQASAMQQANEGESKKSEPSNRIADPSTAKSLQASKTQSTASKPSGATMTPPTEPSQDPPETNASAPPDNSNMQRRGLDVPQPSSSQSMQLKITENVGSYEGDARRKTEVAVAGTIFKMEKSLVAARLRLTKVLQSQTNSEPWNDDLQGSVNEADSNLQSAIQSVKELLSRTKETPYAFIGIQLAEITHTNIRPAQQDAAAVADTTGETRVALLLASRQQTVRAIERLKDLYRTFERAKNDYEKADDVKEIAKMYRIYLEDSLAELSRATKQDPAGLKRTMAELDLDEEYLKRLQEVLEMRNELRAELAKILANDPRLMNRYFQNFGKRGDSIRLQLFEVAKQQSQLHGQLQMYDQSGANTDPLLSRHGGLLLVEAQEMVQRAFEIEEMFETWLPLQENEIAVVQATRNAFLNCTATATKITSGALNQDQNAGSGATTRMNQALSAHAKEMVRFIESLNAVATQLARLSQADPQYASNAVRRAVDLAELRDQAARWNQKAGYLANSQPLPAIGVEQLKIAVDTHTLTEKLSGLQTELSRMLGGEALQLPKAIADRCDVLLQKLDRDIEPIQLAAIRSLQKSLGPKAVVRTGVASDLLGQACQDLDALLKDVIERLDQLPLDPLADLLDDPTLDEILAILEQERDLAELLGLPARPINLQILSDWASGNSGSGGMGQGGSGQGGSGQGRARLIAMIRAAMEKEGKETESKLDEVRKRLQKVKYVYAEIDSDQPQRTGAAFGWNVVRSQLGSGLLQGSDGLPPEAYRRSIDRYFDLISGSLNVLEADRNNANQ